MTESFCNLLQIFACGARGEKIQNCCDMNLSEIKMLAKRQSVFPMVCYALNEMDGECLKLTADKVRRNYLIKKVIDQLIENGIECVYLKGVVLDNLYPYPELRLSTDTDILVPKDKEETINKILIENDFCLIPRKDTSNEQKCVHKVAGLLELHYGLDNELMSKIWFDGKTEELEPFRKFTAADGQEYMTLSVTDGFMQLVLHFIKHYINRAGNIKMIMDILMYIQQYDKEINWEKINSLMDYLNYSMFFKVLLTIGKEYLGFPNREASIEKNLADKVLTDMEEACRMGNKNVGNLDFYHLYSEERKKRFQTEEYKEKKYISDILKSLFPKRSHLINQYPILKKHPAFLPFIWTKRICKFVLRDKKSEKKYIQDRMSLIRELDMI